MDKVYTSGSDSTVWINYVNIVRCICYEYARFPVDGAVGVCVYANALHCLDRKSFRELVTNLHSR